MLAHDEADCAVDIVGVLLCIGVHVITITITKMYLVNYVARLNVADANPYLFCQTKLIRVYGSMEVRKLLE